MSDLHSLLEKLEKCEGPDRGIDGFIARDVLGWEPHFDLYGEDLSEWDDFGGHWHRDGTKCDSNHKMGSDDNYDDPPKYTASLDAAVALVKNIRPGWFFSVAICYMSAHGYLGVDYNGPHKERLFREFDVGKYDEGFNAELEPGDEISTACRVLLHMLIQSLIAEEEK